MNPDEPMSTEQAEKDGYWLKGGGNDLLKGKPNWQEFFISLPDHQKAFVDHSALRYLGCMDERDKGRQEWNAYKIGLGGAAIGYTERVPDFLPKQSILVGTSSHRRNCGYATLFKEENGLVNETVNQVADDQAKITAEMLGIPYLGVVEDYNMNPPVNFHPARAMYYDGGGYFVPYLTPELPEGLLISRGMVSNSEYSRRLAKIAMKIVLEHGFSRRFTQDSPFYAVIVTEPGVGIDKEAATVEVKRAIDELTNEIGGEFNGHLPVKVDYIEKVSV